MDYENGKIYKITGGNMTYYGSTTQILSKRLYQHKHKSNMCYSKKILELGNYDICLVELFPCKSKEELHMRERFYIENNECVNKNIPNRTQEEIKEYQTHYRIDNADKIKEKDKQKYNKNADKIKQYYIDNADKFKQYNIDNADKIKQYNIDNADKIKERRKQYNIDNANKIKERRKQYDIDNANKIKERRKQYNIKTADKRKQYRIDNADKIKNTKKE
jgi:hypothetical protein